MSLRDLFRILGIAAIYFAAAKVALVFAIPPGYATPVWPPAGIALAALMRGGVRLWPGVLIGAAAVNFTIQHSIPVALIIGAGNALGAVVGALLAQRAFGEGRDPFQTPSQIFLFFGIALVGPLVSASIGTGGLYLLGILGPGPVFLNWATWWLGDAAGILIIGPLMLAWTAPIHHALRPPPYEMGAFYSLLAAVCAALYLNWNPGGRPLPIGFIVLPPLAWAALRFGEREVTTGCAVVAGVTVWQASQGGGPFSTIDRTQGLLLLQTFLAMLTATSLALAVAAQALRRTRAELEQFIDTAAHDLQEPLRNILSFSDLLRLRYLDKLDRDGQEFLGYVVDSGTRMQRRIEDLLAVARASRSTLHATGTESGAARAAALDSLRASIEETGAQVTHDELPRVHADPRMLESVFQNLVGNALKFRSAQAPKVHVSARRADNGWVFSVQDNGIGIDPRHFERIFEMFERLDRTDGSESSGVGLAICRRIVERHGGRMWVQSTPSQGATFSFVLPAARGSKRG
jgi:signal transduction histidine kinase